MKINYVICKEYQGLSILDYFKSFYLGKSRIYKLFEENRVFINDNVAKSTYVLKENDVLCVDYDEKIDFIPDKKKLDIVYEDGYLLIVNKPSNILVHPDDKLKNGTMVNIVSYYYQNKGYELTVKYAHRLDIDTTGLLIFVKDSLTKAKIDNMISTHELKRTYLCLASGHFKEKAGTINAPIGEDRHHKQRRRVSKTGQEAITHYEVIKEFNKYSLLRVVLETGRTHQIRVHLSSIGHPLLGDELYGGPKGYKRFMLHSYEVDFIHPVSKKRLIINKNVPFDMGSLIGE